MTRYFVKAAHNWGDEPVYIEALSVQGLEPVKTGLIDRNGDPIYRAYEQVGFVTDFKPRIRVKARTG